jgi:hypothetical protein
MIGKNGFVLNALSTRTTKVVSRRAFCGQKPAIFK